MSATLEEAGPDPGSPDRGRRPRGAGSQGGALARLLLVVAAGVAAAVVTHAVDLLIVVLALAAMIMLHELGHFATAKWGRMKVTEYFLGFGPRVWSVRRGETEYGVKAIPAGGYVKVLGMSNAEKVDPADEPRTYRQASFGRRFSVAVAGSAVHYILAFLLLWSFFTFVGRYNTSRVSVAAVSSFTSGTSPAQRAGFQAGDVFLSVDGHPITDVTQLEAFIQSHPGRRLTVVVGRHGQRVTLHVVPVHAAGVQVASGSKAAAGGGPRGADGIIGVDLTSPKVRSNPLAAIGQGASQTWSLTTASVTGLAHIFSPQGITTYVGQVAHAGSSAPGASKGSSSSTGPNSDRLLSIFGAARVATQAAQAGAGPLLLLLASINVFIGLFNMFPMLPLDGGHVVIAVYERLRSRRGRRYHADVTKLLPATYAVMLVLVAIGISALYLDIVNPIPNPFR